MIEEKNPFRKQLNLLSLRARFRVQEMSKNFSSKIKLNKTQKNENIKLTYFIKNNFLSKNLKKKSLDQIVEYEKLCSDKVNFVHGNLEKSKFYTYEKLPLLKKNKSLIINLHKKKNSCIYNLKKNSCNDSIINNYENNNKTLDSINEKNQKKIYKNLSYYNIFPQISINNNNKNKQEKKKQKENIIQFENVNDFIYYKLNNKQFYNELNNYSKKFCIKL